jgi:alpha-galactosidase
VKRDIKASGLPAKIAATTDRREAFKDANYVFSFIRAGGLEAFETDINIPLKYGVDQCIGDTLAPGGIMYAQRTIPPSSTSAGISARWPRRAASSSITPTPWP